MTRRDIISKLTAELDAGITTEAQVVYLLAGIRKIVERDKIRDQYPDLNFHCDWALHSSLDRSAAKAILREFDAAHALLRGNIKLRDLPTPLRAEIDRISKMRSLEKELSEFLTAYGLPQLTKNRPDGWAHFLQLYARVVEDIPLVVSSPAVARHITHVTVHFDQAREAISENPWEKEMLFRVTWTTHDRNGQSGNIFVINSYALILSDSESRSPRGLCHPPVPVPSVVLTRPTTHPATNRQTGFP